MSQRITQTGQVSYRTKLMELERAASFAKALGANDRFKGVTIETSARAKSAARYFVQFSPTNTDRYQEMLDREQDARALRACEGSFTFLADKDAGRAFYWCHSHQSGEVYQTTEQTCSCPDATFRCAPNGLLCKHSLAIRNADPADLRA